MARPKNLHLLTGRPSRFSTEGALEILARMEAGEYLHRICEAEHLPAESTVWGWVHDGKHPWFAEMFRKAREIQGHKWAAEVVEIADESARAQSAHEVYSYQLRCNSRKWASARAAPEYYAERPPPSAAGGAHATITIYMPAKVNDGSSGRVIEGTAKLEDGSEDEQPEGPSAKPRPQTELFCGAAAGLRQRSHTASHDGCDFSASRSHSFVRRQA